MLCLAKKSESMQHLLGETYDPVPMRPPLRVGHFLFPHSSLVMLLQQGAHQGWPCRSRSSQSKEQVGAACQDFHG